MTDDEDDGRPARARLLAAVVEHVAAHGLGDLSLRRLAAALGTSHRMLIYHFGSKEGLLVAVVREVEERQRRALAELVDEVGEAGPAELVRRFWARLADPALGPHERLFFEVYGRALQGDPGAAPLLDGVVDAWLGPATDAAVRLGVPPHEARDGARLGLAVTRGLLLDLLATGDRAAVDAAMGRFVAQLEASVPAAGTAGGRRQPALRTRRAGRRPA
ncbi:MAG TPA: TetR/AcrR family transcriptional regulator [Acidimicrobiales bacterium]